MSSEPYLITGRRNANGKAYLRFDIETLQNDADKEEQFVLFVLAFLAIQGRPHYAQGLDPGPIKSPATYFQIAAVHGKPYEEYTGDPGSPSERASDYNPNDRKDTKSIPSRFGGYCNHGSVLFPTWHRPYVLLIEQAIGEIADRLAKQIGGTKWTQAAEQLRFPYWDWADPKISRRGYQLPPILYEDKVLIKLPGKTYKEPVTNPLSFFRFPGRDFPFDFKDEYSASGNTLSFFAEWTRTYRHASGEPSVATSNMREFQTELTKQARTLRRRLATLFTFATEGLSSPKTWDQFSNHTGKSVPEPRTTDSLEGVHDTVHVIIGKNGHMSDPDYAGFDPIFFLHHCNIDRLLAYWEWCYADYWMEEGYNVTNRQGQTIKVPWTQDEGTYAEVYNERVLPGSALAPFRNGESEYWTSVQARFLHDQAYPKYYSYPEFQGVDVTQVPADLAKREQARKNIRKYFDPSRSSTNVYYVVAVTLEKHTFNRSYNLEVFFEGQEGQSTSIGSVTVFARSDSSPCAACSQGRATGSVVRGVIPIPDEIVDYFATSHSPAEGIRSGLTSKLLDPGGIHLGIPGEWLESRDHPKIVLLSIDLREGLESSEWNHHGTVALQDLQ